MTTVLVITPRVKAMASQRWIWRMSLLTGTSLELAFRSGRYRPWISFQPLPDGSRKLASTAP